MLDELRLPAAAIRAAEFALAELRDADGRLLRTRKDGSGRLNAYLEDHAFPLEALITLYEATFEPRWFAAACELADRMIERFADEDSGMLLRDLGRPRAARGPAQGPRGPPDPVRQRQGGSRAAAAGGAQRRARLRAHAYRSCGCCTSLRRSTRRRSGTCSRHSTSTSPPREVASWARTFARSSGWCAGSSGRNWC